MKTHTSLFRIVSVVLMSGLMAPPITPTARAEMVSTESFMAQHLQTTPRDRVMNLLQKDEVVQKLQELGVDPAEARQRVASLSDAEIDQINTKIDQLPAGADAAGAIIGTALVVFVVLLITDILCWTKVFKFTRCAG